MRIRKSTTNLTKSDKKILKERIRSFGKIISSLKNAKDPRTRRAIEILSKCIKKDKINLKKLLKS